MREAGHTLWDDTGKPEPAIDSSLKFDDSPNCTSASMR